MGVEATWPHARHACSWRVRDVASMSWVLHARHACSWRVRDVATMSWAFISTAIFRLCRHSRKAKEVLKK